MSKADPIFDKSDTAALDDELPIELKGKTPKQIAEYYQRREAILVERANRPAPAPKKEEPVDDKIDLFNDPAGSVNRVVTRQVNDAMNRMGAIATPAIVNACRIATKDAHPQDWARFAPEVEKRMGEMNAEGQMNPTYWSLMYNTVKGEVADKLVEEAVQKDRNRRENPVEHSTPPGDKPPKPRELTTEEKTVAYKFSMSEEDYRTAADRYDVDEGRLPMTTDSKKARKKGAA